MRGDVAVLVAAPCACGCGVVLRKLNDCVNGTKIANNDDSSKSKSRLGDAQQYELCFFIFVCTVVLILILSFVAS